MEDYSIKTASDLTETFIRTEAPFYGIDTSDGLLARLGKKLVGNSPRHLRFPPSHDRKLIDPETNAWWEPLPLDDKSGDWFYGQITMDETRVGEYFYDYTFRDSEEVLIPDIFVMGELIVSERARDIINNFAPGYCYFSPVTFTGRESGRQTATSYFKVYVRQTLTYRGPNPTTKIRPQGQRRAMVPWETWTALCENSAVRQKASELPIFLIERQSQYPMLNAELVQRLKRENVSGLLETTAYIKTDPERPAEFHGFETVFPMDPGYREPSKI